MLSGAFLATAIYAGAQFDPVNTSTQTNTNGQVNNSNQQNQTQTNTNSQTNNTTQQNQTQTNNLGQTNNTTQQNQTQTNTNWVTIPTTGATTTPQQPSGNPINGSTQTTPGSGITAKNTTYTPYSPTNPPGGLKSGGTTGGTTSTAVTTTGSQQQDDKACYDEGGKNVCKLQNPIGVNDLSEFVAKVLGIILKIAIPVIAAFIIYSGLMFVLARGNTEKLEKAKTRLLYTLIGAGILLGAWMIATVIKATIEALMA